MPCVLPLVNATPMELLELPQPDRPSVRRVMNPHNNTATGNFFDDIANLDWK
jgi:hypothetical protein